MLFISATLGDYWEGQAYFAPDNRQIKVFVDGAVDNDFSNQHKLYAQNRGRLADFATQNPACSSRAIS